MIWCAPKSKFKTNPAVCILYEPHFILESRFRDLSWLSVYLCLWLKEKDFYKKIVIPAYYFHSILRTKTTFFHNIIKTNINIYFRMNFKRKTTHIKKINILIWTMEESVQHCVQCTVWTTNPGFLDFSGGNFLQSKTVKTIS